FSSFFLLLTIAITTAKTIESRNQIESIFMNTLVLDSWFWRQNLLVAIYIRVPRDHFLPH
ncbi:hypothetical protein C5167_044353, partial [Papaver somniferum]